MKSEIDPAAHRLYRQKARAANTAKTEASIHTAANAAFATQRFDQVSLADIARRAHVRVPTILRHFGTKEHLFILSTHALMQTSQLTRAQTHPSDLRAIATAVVDHFELHGDMILHFLSQEGQIPTIHAVTEEGRSYHRQWVIASVMPLLPALDDSAREQLLIRICALTDIRFWQTLRHSLEQTRAETERTMFELMKGAIATAQREDA